MKAKLAAMFAIAVAAVAILAVGCGSSGEAEVRVEKGLAASAGQLVEGEDTGAPEAVAAAVPPSVPLGAPVAMSRAAGVGGELAPSTIGLSVPFAQGAVGGISVQGFGRATVPADSARVQFVVTQGYDYYYPEYPEPLPDEPFETRPEGGIESEIAPAVTPEIYPTPVPPQPLTEEDLEPLIEAIQAEGVSEDDIEVTIYLDSYYDPYWREDTARVTVTLRDMDKVGPVVEAGTTAMEMARVISSRIPTPFLQNVGVIYRVDDCDELLEEARRAAVEDGRDNAQDLADVLGVSRGELLAASEYSYDPTGYSGCTEDPYYYGSYEYEGSPYDPAAPAEVQIVSNVSLTFAIE